LLDRAVTETEGSSGLFFLFDSKTKMIIFAWVNDDQTLRSSGAKTDSADLAKSVSVVIQTSTAVSTAAWPPGRKIPSRSSTTCPSSALAMRTRVSLNLGSQRARASAVAESRSVMASLGDLRHWLDCIYLILKYTSP